MTIARKSILTCHVARRLREQIDTPPHNWVQETVTVKGGKVHVEAHRCRDRDRNPTGYKIEAYPDNIRAGFSEMRSGSCRYLPEVHDPKRFESAVLRCIEDCRLEAQLITRRAQLDKLAGPLYDSNKSFRALVDSVEIDKADYALMDNATIDFWFKAAKS